MARTINRGFTSEDLHYFHKLEKLANDRLTFFREKQILREKHAKDRMESIKAMLKRAWSDEEDEFLEERVKERKKSKAKSNCREVDVVVPKKKKVPKKAVRVPVVNNEITERLKAFVVNELNGTDMKLVIQKNLYHSDIIQSQNRLSMPMNQLETNDFLTEDEKRILLLKNVKENEIEVGLLGPTLEMFVMPMNLKMWYMASSVNYVLKTNWYDFRKAFKGYLQEGVKIQVWSFRRDGQLCFAIACVDEPDGEDDVA